jgi:Rod binding domain-containing protein
MISPQMTAAQIKALPVAALNPAQAAAARLSPAEREAAKAKIAATAKTFEATFIAQMMGSMFKGVDMGGGETGEQFKSVMMDAMAKKISNNGGIGLSSSIQAEMLKLQGLN